MMRHHRAIVAGTRTAAAAAFLLMIGMAAGCGRSPSPDIFFVTIDTLRADHLGAYGYPRDTSPNLDRLARDGVLVRTCYSVSTTTGPSHASLFTAVYPQTVAVTSNSHKFSSAESLMDLLRANGYETAAFVSSYIVKRGTGFENEFDHFDDELTRLETRGLPERPAGETIRAVQKWLGGRSSDRPLFVWIHLIDPHGPYDPPAGADHFVGDEMYRSEHRTLEFGETDFERNRIPGYQRLGDHRDAAFYLARYDAEIRYADSSLGALFRGLEAGKRFAKSIVVVTADHGETLLEHSRHFTHSVVAYEEVARVPLILKDSEGSRRFSKIDPRVTARTIDVAPTIAAGLGLEPPPSWQGRDLNGKQVNAQPIYTFGDYGANALATTIGTQFSILEGPYRYIINTNDHSEELYDHAADPTEQTSKASVDGSRLPAFRSLLRRFLAAHPVGPTQTLEPSEERTRQLRALGYVN